MARPSPSSSGTVLPDDARECVDMLLILATGTVAVDGREALGRGLDCVARAEVRLAALGDDQVLRVRCAKTRLFCFYYAARHREAAEAAETVASLARQGGLRYEECAHLHNAGEQYLRLADHPRARASLTASLEMARDLGADGGDALWPGSPCRLHLDGNTSRLHELGEAPHRGGRLARPSRARYWPRVPARRAGSPRGARAELTRALEMSSPAPAPR